MQVSKISDSLDMNTYYEYSDLQSDTTEEDFSVPDIIKGKLFDIMELKFIFN